MEINKTNVEIEFKCLISEEIYNSLIKEFNATDIKEQTNHYFDSDNLDLKKDHIVLRIRQKKTQYKLTSKVNQAIGINESHVFLTENEGINMINNGFDASIIGLNYYVHKIGELTTYRVSFPYENGKIFFDKSLYNGIVDYEIEFEANEYSSGKETFEKFLESHDIPLNIPKSKFVRTIDTKKGTN